MTTPVFYLQYPTFHQYLSQVEDKNQPNHSAHVVNQRTCFSVPPCAENAGNYISQGQQLPPISSLATSSYFDTKTPPKIKGRRSTRRLVPNPESKNYRRPVFTQNQRRKLDEEYSKGMYISLQRKRELAMTIGLTEQQIKVWFQNRRAMAGRLRRQNSGKKSVPADNRAMTVIANAAAEMPRLDNGKAMKI